MDRRLFLLLALAACTGAEAPGALYEIAVLRHADRDPNALVLNATGEARAANLPAALAGVPLDAILLPDRERNRQTAAPLAAERGLTPQVIALGPGLSRRILTAGHRRFAWIGNQTNLVQLWQELEAPGDPPTGYGEITLLRGRGPGAFTATTRRFEP